ncbi:peptide chain release factor N(5)-glutamine methyltransferase [Tabrizicola sp. BL-A-41-H6]|uniref:peptide chain release factor N(5)-glutamine methyltransferase n=1 Tax=Tabrizicola sp. BL-A-41-H6 TaxID=3421107 RepID=UPI003D679790
MIAAEALAVAVARLQAAGISGAGGDARRLMAFAMGIGADRLTLHLLDVLTPEAEVRFAAAVAARERRQPVAQIVGERQFWGRRFAVTPDVLDPRPETETLIEAALAEEFGRVLDLGTGSGAILATLLAERGAATGIGTDVSEPALAVARCNAETLGVAGRATFLRADWFDGVAGSFDLVVSNPPYIAADEMAGIAADVRDWEPHLALTPGGDGLAAYRAIASGVARHLVPGGRLIVEIGPTQGPAVAALFAATELKDITVRPDMDGRDRIVTARLPR